MVLVAIAMLLFWAGWATWTGSSLTLKAATARARLGGGVLMLAGIVGLLYGVRLLAS